MKITQIKLKDVKEGVNPFYTVQWSDATPEQKSEIYSVIAKFNKSKIEKVA